ncbi:MAG: DUF309 domain-containing protein [Blastochloris sp.]|nr:DUF309 domain-containing protein [Blastochloris sp.]
MNQLLKGEENIKLGGVRKPVTILFSDIRGFTSISEALGEEELVVQLNQYFEQMVECVNRYQGTLHKYIGDAVMAVWGDVVSSSPRDDARNAVRCSLAMREQLALLNQRWKSEGRPPFQIGIGLNHGNVLVGNIGATQRREFTVIGDAVNLASRLEGVTKQFHTDFVVGETVQQFLKGEFLVRSVGVLVVKGKTQPVRAYEVLEAFDNPKRLWEEHWVSLYEEAFNARLTRDFDKASDSGRNVNKPDPRTSAPFNIWPRPEISKKIHRPRLGRCLNPENQVNCAVSRKSAKIAQLIQHSQRPGLDPHYVAYFECFNRQDYYEAHDVLEELWLEEGPQGPNYAFYKGLIQGAGAFVHLKLNHLHPQHPVHAARLAPAGRLLLLALRNLEPYPEQHHSLHLPPVRQLWTQTHQAPRIHPLQHQSLAPLHPTPPPSLSLPTRIKKFGIENQKLTRP